jgi:hypothetical protein
MISVAFIGAGFGAQLEVNPTPIADAQVAHAAPTLAEFLVNGVRKRPTVVVAEYDALLAKPVTAMNGLLDAAGAEIGIVVYAFARRAEIEALQSERIRVIPGPVALRQLRSFMLSAIVRRMMRPQEEPRMSSAPAAAPSRAARFTREQLHNLLERMTTVQCECPNHLSKLVLGLLDFEEYSRGCENRNEADREVHAMLARKTGDARLVMEEALVELLRFEQIAI